MRGVQKLRPDDQYTDVTLQSGDVHIRCHRSVLSAVSDYFKAMFTCGLEETTSATVRLMIEPDLLTNIVGHIYTGEIELSVDNVESFVKAGDLLDLVALKAVCGNFLSGQVVPGNCIEFSKFAKTYRLDTLQQCATEVMYSEFKTVANKEEFKQLSCNELTEYIRDHRVVVDSEDFVCESILDWVRHDPDNRKPSFESIFEIIRLPYCSRTYLRRLQDSCDMLTPKCLEYLREALSFQGDPAHQHEISSCRTVPRNNFRMKSCLLVLGWQSRWYTKVKYYDDDTHCWKTLTKTRLSGFVSSVCHTNRGLFLTGGRSENIRFQSTFFDLSTREWTWPWKKNLTTRREYHRSVWLGNCIYVLGGIHHSDDDHKVLASVECLDADSEEWVSMPDMPQAMFAHMVTNYHENIFVFGGENEQREATRSTQVFDTTLRQWDTRADMPVACSKCAAVTLNDFIYVVGGEHRKCLRYDPASDSWTTLSTPRLEHRYALAVVWRGTIVLAGGSWWEPYVFEQYDPVTDAWSYCDIPPLKKFKTIFQMFNVDLSAYDPHLNDQGHSCLEDSH